MRLSKKLIKNNDHCVQINLISLLNRSGLPISHRPLIAHFLVPLLTGAALFVNARRTTQQKLRINPAPILQVTAHHIRHRLDKQRMVVRGGRPANLLRTHLVRQLLAVLNVQLVQRFNVLVNERNRHQDKVLLTLLDVALDGVLGERFEPGQRTDLGLPHQAVRIAVVELAHDVLDGGTDLRGVRIATVDRSQRQGMGGEEDDHVLTLLGGEFLQLLADVVGEGSREQWMRTPAVDDAPLGVRQAVGVGLVVREDGVEAGPGGGTAVLWVLREQDDPFRLVRLDLLEGVFGEGCHIAEGNVVLVGCRLGGHFVQLFAEQLTLQVGPLEDRGPATDLGVLFLNFWRASLGDPRSEFAEVRCKSISYVIPRNST